MPYLRLEDILRPTTTPAQANFLNWFYQNFDSGVAANRKIINVEPLYYSGEIAGTEFLVYAATKLYIALELESASRGGGGGGFMDGYLLHNENNVISQGLYNIALTDGGISRFNDLIHVNYYFSRIVQNKYGYLKFNGYRITLV